MTASSATAALDSDLIEVACALCGRTDGQLLGRRGQHGLPAFVRICPHDGLVYLSPRWTKDRYDRFYAEEYDEYYRPAEFVAGGDERYEAAQFEKGQEVWARLQPLAPAPCDAILEIGSGAGHVIRTVSAAMGGVPMSAVEPSPRSHDKLRAAGIAVIGTAIESDWQAGAPAFDVVIMRHVLEHLLDPVAALRRVRAALGPGGVVYVAVPDMLHPVGDLDETYFRAVHTYYFSLPTLTWLAARAGLEPVATGSDVGEVWAVMRPCAPARAEDSVFDDQLAAIQAHRRRTRRLARRVVHALRSVVGRALGGA